LERHNTFRFTYYELPRFSRDGMDVGASHYVTLVTVFYPGVTVTVWEPRHITKAFARLIAL